MKEVMLLLVIKSHKVQVESSSLKVRLSAIIAIFTYAKNKPLKLKTEVTAVERRFTAIRLYRHFVTAACFSEDL